MTRFASAPSTLTLVCLLYACSDGDSDPSEGEPTTSPGETNEESGSGSAEDETGSSSPSDDSPDSPDAGDSSDAAEGDAEDDDTSGAEVGDTCAGYLTCLLEVCPECYAGALALYGDGAACWDTPEQSAACDQACETLIDDLGDQCQCEGSECTVCTTPLSSRYRLGSGLGSWTCSDGEYYDIGVWELNVFDLQGRDVSIQLSTGLMPMMLMTGTQPCAGGTFEASSHTEEPNGYAETWVATLTPTDDAFEMTVSISASFQFTSGATRVCTLEGLLADQP